MCNFVPHGVCCFFFCCQGETSRILPKPNLSSNHWAFITGSAVASLPAGTQQAAASIMEQLLAGITQQLQDTPGGRRPGCNCVMQLTRCHAVTARLISTRWVLPTLGMVYNGPDVVAVQAPDGAIARQAVCLHDGFPSLHVNNNTATKTSLASY